MIKTLILFVVIILVAAVVASFIFAPANEGHDVTNIEILNNNTIGENSTLYLQLSNLNKEGLSNKTIHIQITDKNGSTVYKNDVKTYATGVARAKLANLSAGEYTINVTFDGDGEYEGSSISKKINIAQGHVDDAVENSTLIEQTNVEAQNAGEDISTDTSTSTSYTPSYSQSSSSSYSSSSSSSGSSSSSEGGYYDEYGNPTLPEYDTDGKEI